MKNISDIIGLLDKAMARVGYIPVKAALSGAPGRHKSIIRGKAKVAYKKNRGKKPGKVAAGQKVKLTGI
jgi:hypothetical protein